MKFLRTHGTKMALAGSGMLTLFSVAMLVRSQYLVPPLNDSILSDRVLGESETSYPYFLDFSEQTIPSLVGEDIMLAGRLTREDKTHYVIRGENQSLLEVENTGDLPSLQIGEETPALVAGTLAKVGSIRPSHIYPVASILSSARLEQILGRELSRFRDCIKCEKSDVLSCIGPFKISRKAAIRNSSSEVLLDYAAITRDDNFYRISVNILNNAQLVFQDSNHLGENCK